MRYRQSSFLLSTLWSGEVSRDVSVVMKPPLFTKNNHTKLSIRTLLTPAGMGPGAGIPLAKDGEGLWVGRGSEVGERRSFLPSPPNFRRVTHWFFTWDRGKRSGGLCSTQRLGNVEFVNPLRLFGSKEHHSPLHPYM